jgi:hypothetical protein
VDAGEPSERLERGGRPGKRHGQVGRTGDDLLRNRLLRPMWREAYWQAQRSGFEPATSLHFLPPVHCESVVQDVPDSSLTHEVFELASALQT